MLPDLDGFEVCRRLARRGNDVPVIFLTARDTSSDTVTGWPWAAMTTSPSRSRWKRWWPGSARCCAAPARPADEAAGGRRRLLRVGDLELDESRWTVHRAGTPVELSPTEFRLLAYLMRHQGRVLTRGAAAGERVGLGLRGQSQIVETYVSYLRRKLDPLGPPADPHPARGRLQPAARRSPSRVPRIR